MTKHDLVEYRFAKQVVEDFPSLIKQINDGIKALRPHRKYASIDIVMDDMAICVEKLTNNLEYYSKIKSKLGVKDE
jgi:hypothetical protein